MTLKPLADRLLVKRIEGEEDEKIGKLVIPDTAKEKPQKGIVLAVGPGRITDDGKRQPMQVKVNDKIFFGKYAGIEVKVGDEEFLIMKEEDVYAIIE